MKIKSAKSFRSYYKEEVKEIPQNSPTHNENYIGTYHTKDGKKIKGFFEMYHGHKPDIAGYLPSILKIAEDGQAVYEFMQNAVDCNSTHFYIFYNEKYFLAINNGEAFDLDGLQSILNIAQTTKRSCEKIGRFGIGFKLAHRLVGKNEGVEELVKDYKGPIMFSWSEKKSLKGLLNKEPLNSVSIEKNNIPFLLKILLTNFPIEPNEEVRDLDYKNQILFTQQELDEFVDFLSKKFKQHSAKINLDDFSQGSIFFIRLGKGKKDMLDRDYEDLKKGIQYSMNTLKNLEHVFLNDKFIEKQSLELEEFEIDKNSEKFKQINPEYKDCNIKITYGYYNDYMLSGKLKSSPNFYKYFPMGDETNGFSFIIHCDSFSNEANRRKLQKDDVNKHLLPEIAEFIIHRLSDYKSTNRERFLKLYTSILLSDIPNKQNNEWLKPVFFNNILEYIQDNIPTADNKYSADRANVKINKLNIEINLVDFGLEHIQWFEWKSKEDSGILQEARSADKLDLEYWYLKDLILNGNLNKINNWLKQLTFDEFNEFVAELRKITETSWERNNQSLFKKFTQLEYFKFSDGNFSSIEKHQNFENYIILNHQLFDIKDILQKLGFIVSERVLTNGEDSSYLSRLIHDEIDYLRDEKILFDRIKVNINAKKLDSKDKKQLFKYLSNLKGVGEIALKSVSLFCNNGGEVKPLGELVDDNLISPHWIRPYKIDSNESFPELKKHLISENEIYSNIIIPYFEEIKWNIKNIEAFYERIKNYYNLNDANKPFDKQNFVFINDFESFLSKSDIFYNKNFTKVKDYKVFQDAIYQLTEVYTPNKKILNYFKEVPFKLESKNLFDNDFSKNIQLSFEGLKSILSFCKINNEHFFQNYVIEEINNNYIVSPKTDDVFQVFPNKKARKFIKKKSLSNFKILPYKLDEYKEEYGILYKEAFYKKFVGIVDINEFKNDLIDIVSYDEPKRNFLLNLSEIRFEVNKKYDAESFEYKVLEMACDNKILDSSFYSDFRKKIIIETEKGELNLTDIPPIVDKIKFNEVELALSKILPSTYKNSKYLGKLIETVDLPKERLNAVLGIQEQEDYSVYYNLLLKELPLTKEHDRHIIIKIEQLAFLVLYNEYYSDFKFYRFCVYTYEKKYVYFLVKQVFYTSFFSFIKPKTILRYSGIEKYNNILSPFKQKGGPQFIEEPIIGDIFYCPHLKDELTKSEQIDFIEFLFKKWKNESNTTKFRTIDWSKINNIETQKILGFNPNDCVYPKKYAYENEELPKYLSDWINNDSAKVEFIKDLGVWTIDTTLVRLRQYFMDRNNFNKLEIAQEKRFSKIYFLGKTLYWIADRKITLDTEDGLQTFKEIIKVINSYDNTGVLIEIKEEYDFKLLKVNSIELDTDYYYNWKHKLDDKFRIFLYDDFLPKTIKININIYTYYSFKEGNIAIDQNNNIYIKSDTDIKKALGTLISLDNDFTTEDLLLLYQVKGEDEVVSSTKVEELESEVERLRNRIAELEGVSGVVSYNATVSYDNTYHDEIKIKSESHLFEYLKSKYPNHIVKWLNYDEKNDSFQESWENHDFEVLESDGTVLHYIDCKGTPKTKKTFYLTKNEWDFFLRCTNNKQSYQIYRVFNVESNMEVVYIDNLLKWIKKGKVVPYLSATEKIKGGRVFLTIKN